MSVTNAFEARRLLDSLTTHSMLPKIFKGIESRILEHKSDTMAIQEPYDKCVELHEILLKLDFKVGDIRRMDGALNYGIFSIWW